MLATISVPLDCDPEPRGLRPTRIAAASLIPIVKKWVLKVSAIDFGSVSETQLASILDGGGLDFPEVPLFSVFHSSLQSQVGSRNLVIRRSWWSEEVCCKKKKLVFRKS